MSEVKKFIVSHSEVRLAAFLKEKTQKSLRSLKKLIDENHVWVNGQIERFSSSKVQKGDVIECFDFTLEFNSLPLTLYEDDFFKIINKPYSSVCSSQNFSPFFLVHRLDKDTTGCLILAKTKEAKQEMEKLFRAGSIHKIYHGLTDGAFHKEKGEIKSFLVKKRSYQGGCIWGSAPQGKLAITHWKVLKKQEKATYLEIEPKTGRTHQIRVHLKEHSHPILGDYQYNKKFRFSQPISRQMLHAYSLCFEHPFLQKKITVKAPHFEDFLRLRRNLRL